MATKSFFKDVVIDDEKTILKFVDKCSSSKCSTDVTKLVSELKSEDIKKFFANYLSCINYISNDLQSL